MIAGPIVPRTLESLWDLVRQEPERLERGLELLAGELVVEGGLVIDALARDAVGAPVLIFGAALGNDAQLASRLFEARDWFARNARILSDALSAPGVRLELPARFFVVAFDYSENCLQRLRAFGDDNLIVFRFEGFILDGQRHVGVVPVLGGGGRTPAPFQAPPAFVADGRGPLVAGFMDLLRRLDSEVRSEGDRYSRTYWIGDTLLCELRLRGQVLEAEVPGFGVQPMVTEADRTAIFDDVMRSYISNLATARSDDELILVGDAEDRGRFDAEPRSDRTEISREEYDAFESFEAFHNPI